MRKIILSIEGMTCSACSNGLEKYLNRKEKIKKAEVNLVMATATIEYNDDLEISEIEKYIEEAGFKSLGMADFSKEEKEKIKPLIVYGILLIVIMYISMQHMTKLPIVKYLDKYNYPLIYALTILILTIPYIIYGLDIIKSGVKNFIHKMPNMDTLVSLGVIASLIFSIYSLINILLGNNYHVENLYFESIACVIYFIKLGRFIDKNAHRKTKENIKKLVTVTPKYAKIKTKDGIKEITIDEIKKNDLLICLPGDKIAVDGIVVKGKTHTDESFITGESYPVKKEKNSHVIAGSINYDGTIEYSAEHIGKESAISEIVKLVVEATTTKGDYSNLADRICSYFVPVILGISIFTLIISLVIGQPLSISLIKFVTILVVACPCALGLATPLAIVVSVGLCAKNGILIKSSKTLEIMNKVDCIVFDKTGTLTNGNLQINKIYNYSNYNDLELLSILGTLEYSSNHPIAKSIINYLDKNKIEYKKDILSDNISGKGISTKINKKMYYVGNEKIIKDLNIKNNFKEDESNLKKTSNSIIYIIEDNKIIGLLGIKDTIRNNSKKVIKKLLEKNIEVIMLTGDNKETSENIAKEIKIKKVISDVLPKDKKEVIEHLKQERKVVAMVGDGINDAPSLISANIGISISSATDIASDSADVILMNNNLERIVDLIEISKKTIINIKENLFWAFFYNITMIPIAIGLLSKFNVTINPMMASIAMVLSSVFVAINALRLKYIKIKKE